MIDSHVHICPDNLAEKNVKVIKDQSGISPAYNGTLDQLIQMMERGKISIAFANNTVLKAELMKKANDWTASVSSTNKKILGMGWIIPGLRESVEEVERCINQLGFKALKMHHSHFKILPSDTSNFKIYEKIVHHKIPVLFHCGRNPYVDADAMQYSIPSSFLEVVKSFPEMKIIFGHLAGYQDDRDKAIELLSFASNAVADTAIDLEEKRSEVDLESIIKTVGVSKLIFGSDYPIHDGVKILRWIRESRISQNEVNLICSANPLSFFGLGSYLQ